MQTLVTQSVQTYYICTHSHVFPCIFSTILTISDARNYSNVGNVYEKVLAFLLKIDIRVPNASYDDKLPIQSEL